MLNWLKSKLNLRFAFAAASSALAKPAETALLAALASQGISIPAEVATVAVEAVMAEIGKRL